jgi:hypothetical protein
MDGKLKSIHGAWIPAIHAGMTSLENSDHVIWQSRSNFLLFLKNRLNNPGICGIILSCSQTFSGMTVTL